MTRVYRVIRTKREVCSHGVRHDVDYVIIVNLRQVGHTFSFDGPSSAVMLSVMEDSHGNKYKQQRDRDRTWYEREDGTEFELGLPAVARALDGTALTEKTPDGEALLWDEPTGAFYFASEDFKLPDDGYVGRHRKGA